MRFSEPELRASHSEAWIKEGNRAVNMKRLSSHSVRSNGYGSG